MMARQRSLSAEISHFLSPPGILKAGIEVNKRDEREDEVDIEVINLVEMKEQSCRCKVVKRFEDERDE